MLSKVVTVICCLTYVAADDPLSHLKPFGWGDSTPMEQVQGFLPVKQFFEEYVKPNKPVVMRGANKVWPGFLNWQTDEYFASVAPEEPFIVSMDIKRGTPETPTDFVDFKEFLQKYNTSTRRMVEHTPPFLWKDVLVPGSLGCDAITQGEILMGHKMWYGSSYSTSVVHKDAADNINCLVYGIKNYTILSPEYDPHVFLDRPDGLYSTMDVDKVDAHKYPGLDKVKFQHTELHGGDCVFIPYKWIHQVRSYDRNIAVNIWWNHWRNNELDLANCPTEMEKKVINSAKFHGWGDFESRDEGVFEHTHDLLSMAHVIKPVTYPRWVALFTSTTFDADAPQLDMLKQVDPDIKKALREAFLTVDADKNRRITPEEMDTLSEEDTKAVVKHIKYVLMQSRIRSQKYEQEDKELEKSKIKPGVKAAGSTESKATAENEERDEL